VRRAKAAAVKEKIRRGALPKRNTKKEPAYGGDRRKIRLLNTFRNARKKKKILKSKGERLPP